MATASAKLGLSRSAAASPPGPPAPLTQWIEDVWPDSGALDWPVTDVDTQRPATAAEPAAAREPAPAPEPANAVEPTPDVESPGGARPERARSEPGDGVFPALDHLLPAYRLPLVALLLVVALLVSRVVPADYPLRPAVVALHVVSVVVSLGAVLLIDWHGLLWLAGLRGLGESTRLAGAADPLIWSGLVGLVLTGGLLRPDLGSPLTLTKLVLVFAVIWNGAALSVGRHRLAALPADCTPAQLPQRDWRLLMTSMVVSQTGWWGAVVIGFINSSR